MRKSVVAGILAAVAGVLVLVVAMLWDRGGSAARPDLRQAPDDAGPSRAPRDLDVDPAWRRELASRPLRSAPDVDSDAPQSHPAATAEADSLRVLVVDEATGFPVPGADVAWCDERAEAAPPGSLPRVSRLVADFDHAARRTVADGRGIAWIQTCRDLGLGARLGNQFGYRRFRDPPRGEVRIPIAAGFFVAARVVNEAGAPVAGIPVWMEIRARSGRPSSSQTEIAMSRGPDGVAVGRHVSVLPEKRAGSKDEVKAQIEGMPATARTVPLEGMKEGPVTLVMGPTGRVGVRLKGPDGQPLASDAIVSLTATKPGKGGGTLPLRLAATAGSANFSCVPIGIPLSISAEAPGFDTPFASAATLSVPGEEQTVEVRFVRGYVRIKGRSVDDHGAPLGFRALRFEMVESGGPVSWPGTTVVSDAAGEFLFWMDRQVLRRGSEIEVEIRGPSAALEGGAVVPLPKVPDGEEIALGDVRFARAEPLASGTVVDDFGAPVAGAAVYPETLRISQRGRYRGPGARERPARDSTRTLTDAAGRFELPPPAKIRGALLAIHLAAELQGYVCKDPPAVKQGAKDVRIVLLATGSIEGRILLPEPAPVRKLFIALASQGAGPVAGKWEDCVDSEGRFRLTGLLPGPVTALVGCAGVADPLFLLGEVTVPRLSATSLPDVDLRGHPALRR